MDESYTSQDDMDTGDSSEVHKPTMTESTDGSLSPGTGSKAVFATSTHVKATGQSNNKKKKNKNPTSAKSDIEETNKEKVDEEIEMENQDGDPINTMQINPPWMDTSSPRVHVKFTEMLSEYQSQRLRILCRRRWRKGLRTWKSTACFYLKRPRASSR